MDGRRFRVLILAGTALGWLVPVCRAQQGSSQAATQDPEIALGQEVFNELKAKRQIIARARRSSAASTRTRPRRRHSTLTRVAGGVPPVMSHETLLSIACRALAHAGIGGQPEACSGELISEGGNHVGGT
jgi:hypothetical protein